MDAGLLGLKGSKVRMVMKRKYTLAALLNYPSRESGAQLSRVYFVVRTLLENTCYSPLTLPPNYILIDPGARLLLLLAPAGLPPSKVGASAGATGSLVYSGAVELSSALSSCSLLAWLEGRGPMRALPELLKVRPPLSGAVRRLGVLLGCSPSSAPPDKVYLLRTPD